MKERPNKEIREAIKNSSLNKYEIAYKIGIADTTFSVWLRRELTDERRAKVMKAIEELRCSNG